MAALGGAALACALITTLAATPASASAPASPYLEARSSSAPLPTSAEVRQATADFLDSYGSSGGGAGIAGTGGTEPGETEPPPEVSPDALFPQSRVVALYGAPQLGATIIGRKSPSGATAKLRRQARGYKSEGLRPVVRAFDLVSVIATASPGPDRKYRTRQSDEVIAEYLAEVRKLGGRLILDIQPARARIMAEIRALRGWLSEPDVDLVIDAEWNVGRKGIPGRHLGKVRAKELNRASKFLQKLIDEQELPPKLLAVHQFTEKNIRGRGKIAAREDVQVTLNFDGIGTRSGKSAGYAFLSATEQFNGFSLFYRLDRGLMKPHQVLGLAPETDFVMYQ